MGRSWFAAPMARASPIAIAAEPPSAMRNTNGGYCDAATVNSAAIPCSRFGFPSEAGSSSKTK